MNLLDLLSDNPDRDLLTAYRKVKCDLFYGTLPERTKLAEFEKDLKGNLDAIKNALRDGNTNYFLSLAKQGGYWLCPKSFKPENENENVIFAESRKTPVGSVKMKGKAEYRLMADLPISFHVVTTLWILSVGEVLETAVSGDSYGNRIRRTLDGYVSMNALGAFEPYIYQYQKWRENAFKTVRKALDEDKRLIVLTGDFSSFYHTLKPGFLNDDWGREDLLHDVPRELSFFEKWVVDKIDVSENVSRRKGIFAKTSDEKRTLSETAKRFTDIVVQMLKDWAEGTPLKFGLPVGCSISSVIANLALASFDRTIRRDVVPLYYGRYVDDFILVMENTRNETDPKDVWKWLKKRFPTGEVTLRGKTPDVAYVSKEAYPLETLHLNAEKGKAFFLEGESGRDVVETIRQTIARTKSEWRLLPGWIDDEGIAAGIRKAIDENGCDADSFRVVKGFVSRRADLSLKIRTFEAYGRLITDDAWKPERKKLLRSVLSAMDTASFFFDYHSYVFRLFGLFLRHLDEHDEEECRDVLKLCERICKMADPKRFEEAIVADQYKWKLKRTADTPEISAKEESRPHHSCRHVRDQMIQALAISEPWRLSKPFRTQLFEKLDKLECGNVVQSVGEVDETAAGLFVCDLAASPLRSVALDVLSDCDENVSVKDGAKFAPSRRTNPLKSNFGIWDEACGRHQMDFTFEENRFESVQCAVRAVLSSAIGTKESEEKKGREDCDHWTSVSGWFCPTRPFSFLELFALLFRENDAQASGDPACGNADDVMLSDWTQKKRTVVDYLQETRGYNGDRLQSGFPELKKDSDGTIERVVVRGPESGSGLEFPEFGFAQPEEAPDEMIERTVFCLDGALNRDHHPELCFSKSMDAPDGMIGRAGVRLKDERKKIRVAVVNWKTDEASWVASVVGQRDPHSGKRFARFTKLVNRILSEQTSVDYVVFPELSIPVKWYFDAAIKLNRAKISLIAGVEYLHHGRNEVSNEVWCSLHLDSMRFPAAAIVPFRKSKPALEEAAELWKLAHRQFSSGKGTGVCRKICQHGSFCFSVLICSELLEVANRAWMTGRVDALFVPEWNKDTETFDALVEATAMDLHTYVVQCNDRAYGDSRIRCPAKKAHKRDLLRVRGGELDDFNVGTIPFDRLRRFQSSAIPPTGPGEDYKPTPPGFVIADYRRALPCRSPETGF